MKKTILSLALYCAYLAPAHADSPLPCNCQIIDYRVVSFQDLESLEDNVNIFITKGYQPNGNLSVSVYSTNVRYFYQSVVKWKCTDERGEVKP